MHVNIKIEVNFLSSSRIGTRRVDPNLTQHRNTVLKKNTIAEFQIK